MKVTVVGLGYVGSVAAAGLATAGHQVLGVDVDRTKVVAYSQGRVPIYEPGLSGLVREAHDRGNLRFMHNDDVSEPLGEIILIATGTPTTHTGAVELTQVRSALGWVTERQPGTGIILMKSTVPPGTGVRLCDSTLSGTSLTYVSNPEFLREGQAVHDWLHPDRIVVGAGDGAAIETVRELYKGIETPYLTTDITSAEMIKYASNAFLATKISFINEIAALCDRLGAIVDDVGAGIALDPRIGSSFLRAGVGYGGSCFPKDVRALGQLALTNDHNFELLRSVITVNNRQRLQPLYALRERFSRLSGLRVAVLGIAFKPDTDDIREAPSLDLLRALEEDGVRVSAFDPKALTAARQVVSPSVKLVPDLLECVEDSQAVVLMTEWPEIVGADWEGVARRTRAPRFLFDGRNALDVSQMQSFGFEYRGVGRGGIDSRAPRPRATHSVRGLSD